MNSYENKQTNIRSLETPKIEGFENIYVDKKYKIRIKFPEFTAICPKTSLPDFGLIHISYTPQKYCLELKSLKEYFMFYRNVGIFQENAMNKICDDIIASVQPHWLYISLVYNVRGGIETEVNRSYTSPQK